MSCICRRPVTKSSKIRLGWKKLGFNPSQPHLRRFSSPAAVTGAPEKAKLPSKPRRNRANANFSSVENEDLCGHALKLLAPSLEKHRGCNLVDIFPGSGVWSRKIHEFLQPRRHLLVEQDAEFFSEHVKSLRDESLSRFRFLSLKDQYEIGSEWFGNALAELDLPERSGSVAGQPNDDILVLATLTKFPRKPRGRSPDFEKIGKSIALDLSPAEPFLFSYIQTIINQTGLNSFGPVRILFWTYDRDKFHFLPRSVNGRNRVALRTEEVFFPQEIVGNSVPPRLGRRPAPLELASAQSTAKRMEASGVSLPSKRLPLAHRSVLENALVTVSGVHDGDDFTGDVNSAISELHRLQVLFKLGRFRRTIRVPGQRQSHGFTNEYHRMCSLRAHLENLLGTEYTESTKTATEHLDGVVACQNLLNSIELSDFSFDRSITTSELRNRISEASTEMNERSRINIQRVFDEQDGLFRDIPLLSWDHRPFEPLECFPEDFHLKHSLALLDLEPRPLNFKQAVSDTPFVRYLRNNAAISLPEALDQLAHGAADGLIPNCPSITDPHSGGRSDTQNLRVRMLTHEMFRELSEAWNRWPFQISDVELQLDH